VVITLRNEWMRGSGMRHESIVLMSGEDEEERNDERTSDD
jgi:hypothetical protein